MDWYFRALSKNKIIKLANLKPLAYLRVHNEKSSIEKIECEYLNIFNIEIKIYENKKLDKKKARILSKLYLACVPFYKKNRYIDDAWVYLKKSVSYNKKIILIPLVFRYFIHLLYLFIKRYSMYNSKRAYEDIANSKFNR